MQYDTLSHLISALELGTKTHISVVFLDHYGNGKTRLSTPQKIHTCAVCDEAKSTQVGYSNVTYFNRIFRALTGMSPQAYRKG